MLICLALLTLANNFNEQDNPWRAAFDSTGLRWRAWDQRVNYQRNGFVAGLLYNTHVTAMAEPKGYSKAAVEAIAKRYEAEAAAMNEGRTATHRQDQRRDHPLRELQPARVAQDGEVPART